MTTLPTRRRFIAITPLFGVALVGACSPKSDPPAPTVNTASNPPSPPTPTPVTVPDAVANTSPTAAANLPMVDEKDAQAVALGYVDNATKVDATKSKAYTPGSRCSGCALYQGKAGEASGPCPLFAGKRVAPNGWCESWAKKA
jgi:hypothetical protein